MVIKRDLKIGERFRIRHEGNVFRVALIYNRLDEDFPYTVVNLSNWEVMDAYSSVDKIEVHDMFLELNQFLINNAKKDREEYKYTYDGKIFCIYDPNGMCDWGNNVFDEEVTEDEAVKLKTLCELFGIEEDNEC